MSWNHRVFRHSGVEDSFFLIHEVYYDAQGRPEAYTENPVTPAGRTLQELRGELQLFIDALDKPVLTTEAFSSTDPDHPQGAL